MSDTVNIWKIAGQVPHRIQYGCSNVTVFVRTRRWFEANKIAWRHFMSASGESFLPPHSSHSTATEEEMQSAIMNKSAWVYDFDFVKGTQGSAVLESVETLLASPDNLNSNSKEEQRHARKNLEAGRSGSNGSGVPHASPRGLHTLG